ncbi:MAG: YitT family protein [Bacteroidales bacterium]|nr:YitT family protein [Bacteroidales bacterium]
MKDSVKTKVKEYSLLVLGNFIFALGAVMLVEPYGFAPGGTYGLGMVAHHLWGFETELVAVCMDIPLLIIGFILLGNRFGIKTIVSTILLPLFMQLIHRVYGYASLIEPEIMEMTAYQHQIIAALFGGVIYGVGLGLVYRSHATTGGSDIIAMILRKYTKISMGTATVIVDGLITLTTVVAFGDWKLPMYSWIIIFVDSWMIDFILEGPKRAKTMMIITSKADELRDYILNDMGRGATLIPGKGMYSGAGRDIIYVVVERREMIELREKVAKLDPAAFVNVIDSAEILGEGFQNLKESSEVL